MKPRIPKHFIARQTQDIKRESAQDLSTCEASRPQNRHLNRYRDVYPYDHSRVCLDGLPETDYINASLVKVGFQEGGGFFESLLAIPGMSLLLHACVQLPFAPFCAFPQCCHLPGPLLTIRGHGGGLYVVTTPRSLTT